MHFQFDQANPIQVMAYLVGKLHSTKKVKLMKLIYLSDKSHFLRYGHPITGDNLRALPYGPVPSSTLSLLDGNVWPDPDVAYKFLHLDDNTVTLKSDPGQDLLDAEEKGNLEEIFNRYGSIYTWKLVDETHELPEYKEAFSIATALGNKSGKIPYEMILKHSGEEAHFRLGRPVVSSKTIEHLECPFNEGEDADL